MSIPLTILLTIAGGAKLVGAKPIAEQFEEFGLPRAAMFAVGALEVCAAIGVQIEALSFFAATGTVLLMIGALGSHWKVKHPADKFGPALLVLGLAAAQAVWTVPEFG